MIAAAAAGAVLAAAGCSGGGSGGGDPAPGALDAQAALTRAGTATVGIKVEVEKPTGDPENWAGTSRWVFGDQARSDTSLSPAARFDLSGEQRLGDLRTIVAGGNAYWFTRTAIGPNANRWQRAQLSELDAAFGSQDGALDPRLYLKLLADGVRYEQQLAARHGGKGSGLDVSTAKVDGVSTRQVHVACFFQNLVGEANCDTIDGGAVTKAFPATQHMAVQVSLDGQHRPRRIVADWEALSGPPDDLYPDVITSVPRLHVELTLRDFGAPVTINPPAGAQ